MNKLDEKLTEHIKQWLNDDHSTEDMIIQGAQLLVLLNRNKILYQNIIRNPLRPAWVPKLEYELKKYLKIRLDNHTRSEVAQMDVRVTKDAEMIMSEATVVVDEDDKEIIQLKGKRADHDKLPMEIQQLWESNKSRWKKIAQLHATLRTMEKAESCDRYEFLKQMDELDTQYRKKMQEYDEYVLVEKPAEPAAEHTAEPERETVASESEEQSQAEEPAAPSKELTAEEAEAMKLEIGKHRTWLTRNMDKLKKLFLLAHTEQPSALDVQMWEDFVVETNGHIAEVYRLGSVLTNKRIIELRQAGCTVGDLAPLS